jgi:hypothetical protein
LEAGRISAQLALAAAAFALAACRDARTPTHDVPASVDAWARRILAMPVEEACDGEVHADFFCSVAVSMMPGDIRALGATITLQNARRRDRYLDLDWGGGHSEAHGVLIGPAGWTHEADPERGERKLRDGVFAYDLRR